MAGHTDRLIPVTQIDLTDIEWSLGELERTRGLGSRAFAIPEAPVGRGRFGGVGPKLTIGRSISHPDFEPLWSAAEDLGMAAFAHVGFAREGTNAGWANNGAEDLGTFNLLNMMVGQQIGPQLLLASLVYDGVFERHPRLTVVVEEVGIDWLPHLVSAMELSIGRVPAALRDGSYRPSHLVMGTTYHAAPRPGRLPPTPGAGHPAAGVHPLHPVIDQVPPELLCFSSDYPHVEGSDSAVEIFERQLTGASETVSRDFFGGVAQLIGV